MSERIAIIGGGVAGLGAAWALHRAGKQFTVYERAERLGGHAWTIDVPTPSGTVAVDVGNQYVIPLIHPNLFDMAPLLGIEFEPLVRSYTVSWGGDAIYGSSHQRTPLWLRNEAELCRFTFEMFELLNRKPFEVISRSIGSYLDGGAYSAEFTERFIGSVSLTWGVEFDRALSTSMLSYIFSMTSGVFSFFTPASLFRIKGGTRSFIDKLSEPFREHVKVGCGVRQVERGPDGVMVIDETGEAERYDQVILAVDPHAAMEILVAPSLVERRVFAELIPLQEIDTVCHTDTSILIPGIDPRLRTQLEVLENRTLTVNTQTYLKDCPTPILVSYGDVSDIDPSRVLAKTRFRQDKSGHYGLQVKQHVHNLQGKQRTWYCGSWAILPSAEDALCSGFAVAEALGATYPFRDRQRPSAVFDLVRNLILSGRHDFELIM